MPNGVDFTLLTPLATLVSFASSPEFHKSNTDSLTADINYDILTHAVRGRVVSPAVAFIDSLELRFRAKALRAIGQLQQFGPQLPLPHARKLGGYDLWELRVQIANRICRLFYFRDRRGVFVITSGFIKKTTRTSRTEIDRVVNLKNEYNRGESL